MSAPRSGLFRSIPLTIIIAAIVLSGTAVLAIVLHVPQPKLSETLLQRKPDAEHGAYVATLGDCAACHTAAGQPILTGGLPFATPVGTVYSTNITPDRETGIGNYALEDFIRLMRFGVANDGRRVYPAMPYTAYAKASDEDLQDLYAFLIRKVTPIVRANRASDIVWPLSMRWPLALWNLLFLDDHRFTPDPSQSAAWNRGAYIVQGFAHCGTCHTPRGIFFQEKDVAGRTYAYLSGASLDGSSPINLRGDKADGLGAWSSTDIQETLKTGRNALAAVHGPMSEVIAFSTQFLTDEDANAIAVYVKSLPPAGDTKAKFQPSDATYKTIMAGVGQDPGARIYMDSCAACHRLDGQGYSRTFPRLAGNPSVLADNSDSLIAIILQGNRLPSTAGAPSQLAMPPFGWRYSDAEIADLATFVKTSWGNQAPGVTARQVAVVRNALRLEAEKR